MFLFYIFLLLSTAGTAAWLAREGGLRWRFGAVLLGLGVLSLLGGALAVSPWLVDEGIFLLLQLAGWGGLLWGMGLPWLWLGGGVAAALVLGLLPGSPVLLLASWGLVTAVPLATVLTQEQRVSLSITPLPPPQFRAVRGPVTAEMLASQKPILDCLADGVIFSGVDGQVEYANQATAVILKQPLEEIMHQPVTDLLPGLRMLSPKREEANRFERHGRTIQGQMHLIYDEAGKAQGTVAILQDVTDRCRAEASRDQFLTMVSHELRTPLTVIKGYVELLRSGGAGSVDPQQDQFFTTIQRNTNRMIDLVNSLIFVSTIKGGRLEYGAGLADLRQLINQVVRELQPQALEMSQQIHVEIDNRLTPIQADPVHMATVLEELITNAIKFNRPEGQIWITAVLQADQARQQEFAVVSVRDEGPGITPEEQGRVFDDFYHPDGNDIQIRAGGLGMGLSIVRALVEAYNGRIWFESVPNQGSTFSFIVPTQQTVPLVKSRV